MDPLKIDPEDEINQQRKAEHEAAAEDRSIVGAIGRTFNALIRPLGRRRLSAQDREEQRLENDEEQRSA